MWVTTNIYVKIKIPQCLKKQTEVAEYALE
jgi:hypothetical protein